MHPDPTLARLEREVRFLRRCAAASLGLLLLGGAAFQSAQRQRFDEIDVERVNVVEPDGRLAMVIASQARLPGVWMDGKEHGDRQGYNGIIFFNGEGDESGGLTHWSERTPDGVRAGGHLSMDRFESDQVVALNYMERPGEYGAGLTVSHFPLASNEEWFAAIDSIGRLPQDQRDAAMRALRRRFIAEGKWETKRMFVGEEGRTSLLRLNDTRGRPRIQLMVDSQSIPGRRGHSTIAGIELLSRATISRASMCDHRTCCGVWFYVARSACDGRFRPIDRSALCQIPLIQTRNGPMLTRVPTRFLRRLAHRMWHSEEIS